GARQAPRTSACRNRSRRRRHLGRREARRGQRGTPHQLVRGVPGPGAHQPLPSIGGELTMANCTTYLYNDPRLGCALPSGHDGPHVTGSGRGWHDCDDMGVGVAAALIEKEAEESPSVDYETMWWDAERRAEKAEAERDRWHSMWRQRRIKQLAAEKRATRAEAERVRKAKAEAWDECEATAIIEEDRKSTRLNSSHVSISYAVFCLKKKTK